MLRDNIHLACRWARSKVRGARVCDSSVVAFLLSVCSCMVAHITRRLCSTKARYQRAHRHDPRPSSLHGSGCAQKCLEWKWSCRVSVARALQNWIPAARAYSAWLYTRGSHGTLCLALVAARSLHTGATRWWIGKCSRQPSDDKPWTKEAEIALSSTKLLICLRIVLFQRASG